MASLISPMVQIASEVFETPSFATREAMPQTPLEERLHGKRFHHDVHCNASRHKPMGCPGCSCYLKPARPDATGL